jgi:hypothetical protein
MRGEPHPAQLPPSPCRALAKPPSHSIVPNHHRRSGAPALQSAGLRLAAALCGYIGYLRTVMPNPANFPARIALALESREEEGPDGEKLPPLLELIQVKPGCFLSGGVWCTRWDQHTHRDKDWPDALADDAPMLHLLCPSNLPANLPALTLQRLADDEASTELSEGCRRALMALQIAPPAGPAAGAGSP